MTTAIAPAPDASMGPLARYEAMRTALMQCASIDEAAEIHDEAAAVAAYARMRDDAHLEVWSQEIKLRASIRIGELVRAIETGQGGHAIRMPASGRTKSQTIAAAGLRPEQAYRWEKLAGPKDANLQAAGKAGAERYLANARATQTPGTERGLREAVTSAVQAAMGPDAIRQAARSMRAEQQDAKRRRRDAKVVSLDTRTRRAASALGACLYNVIYADPATRFEPYSRLTGMDRAADNHYPTMTVEQLEALQIPAAEDSVLFVWSTVPMLAVTMRLIEVWGFAYKSSAVWTKGQIGNGYWFRNEHELLLVGTRGDIPAPLPGTQCGSHFSDRATLHSAKPPAVRAMIERFYPLLPKLEMFAREAAPGWDAWGNEVEPILQAAE